MTRPTVTQPSQLRLFWMHVVTDERPWVASDVLQPYWSQLPGSGPCEKQVTSRIGSPSRSDFSPPCGKAIGKVTTAPVTLFASGSEL